MEKCDFLILGQGLAGTCLALRLAMSGRDYRIVDDGCPDSASRNAAGLMNPVTGRRMALTWNFEEVWGNSTYFYSEAFHFLLHRSGSFLQKKTIRRMLHTTEEMNFLEAKSAWAGYGDTVQIKGTGDENPVFGKTAGEAKINSGYRLDVPEFLSIALEYFKSENKLTGEKFLPEELKEAGNFWNYKGMSFRNVVSCLGLGCPWVSEMLWPVKGQIYVLEGLPDWGDDVQKTEHFLIPLSGDQVLAGSTYEREFSHLLPDKEGYETITASIRPELKPELRIARSWAALRPTTPDRRPVIRELKRGLWAINGLGAKGVSLAPFAAEEYLRLIQQVPESAH